VDFALSIEILAQNHSIFRDAEISLHEILHWSFFSFFFPKNMKSGVPAALGRVVKAEFESHPQISSTKNIAFCTIDTRKNNNALESHFSIIFF